jgi:hypothetical protein
MYSEHKITFPRGILTGICGGLAGTAAMQVFGTGIFTILGWETNTSYRIIGDSAAAFFSGIGIRLPGGPAFGILLYYLIGLAMGGMLGVGIVYWEPVQRAYQRHGVILSVIYVEVLSIPLLAAGAFSLQMSAVTAGLWFSISFVMHLVYGIVLGIGMNIGFGVFPIPGSIKH